jgi:hypothetical protein
VGIVEATYRFEEVYSQKGGVMKLLLMVLMLMILVMSPAVRAEDQEVQIDLLMSKITTLLKDDKAAKALPYMAELESMEPSMSKPLPESFHFYYIDTLDKAGDRDKALSRANLYLKKFGKKGKNYGRVIDILSRLQIEADRVAETGFKLYTDMVQDTRTGLIWARNGNIAGSMRWNDAMEWVKSLDIGGYRDWRLPTKEELVSLAKRGGGRPYAGLNSIGFRSIESDWYWSSSPDVDHTYGAWLVGMAEGVAVKVPKGVSRYVWPVRAGQ